MPYRVMEVISRLMSGIDRTTTIGQMIDGYLKSNVEMEDHVIHLLFSANRWEAA
jgi:dTMP kinase